MKGSQSGEITPFHYMDSFSGLDDGRGGVKHLLSYVRFSRSRGVNRNFLDADFYQGKCLPFRAHWSKYQKNNEMDMLLRMNE